MLLRTIKPTINFRFNKFLSKRQIFFHVYYIHPRYISFAGVSEVIHWSCFTKKLFLKLIVVFGKTAKSEGSKCDNRLSLNSQSLMKVKKR